ncbi:MAG: hypothetical protein CMF45_08470 [Legionellales bacterium]|nr:hypothetical protein [Legionellales bacterium]
MMLDKLMIRVFVLSVILNLVACVPANRKNAEEEPVPDLVEILKQADIAYENKDYVTSEKNYEILIKEFPTEAEYWFRLGNIYVLTKRPNEAVNVYREALIRNPKFSKAWYNLSIVQLKQTAFSLNEMLAYTNNEDPLHIKAEIMLKNITSIISEE